MSELYEMDNQMEPAFVVKGRRPLSYESVDKLLVDADDTLTVSDDGYMWRTATLSVREIKERRLVEKLRSVGSEQGMAAAEWFMERQVETTNSELVDVAYVNSEHTKWGAFHD